MVWAGVVAEDVVSGTDTGVVAAEVVGAAVVGAADVVVGVVGAAEGAAEVVGEVSLVFSAEVVGVADVVGAAEVVVSVSAPLPPALVAALLPPPDVKAPVLSARRLKTPRSIQPA